MSAGIPVTRDLPGCPDAAHVILPDFSHVVFIMRDKEFG